MFKKVILVFTVLSFIFALCGCASEKKFHLTETMFAMDTVMTIELYGKNAEQAYKEIEKRIREVEAYASVGNKDSLIGRLNRDKKIEANEDLLNMFKTAVFYAQETNGALDISTQVASEAWGFGKDEQRIPDEHELKTLLKSIDFQRIQIDGNIITIPDDMVVGLGAVAKGYCADIAVDISKKNKLDFAIINLGGNIACYGKPLDGEFFGIGIEDPYQPGTAIAVIQNKDKSLVSSGNYQRFFERGGVRYHHILDPKTAAPALTDVNMITVVCDSSTSADCLSTALYVLGEVETIEYWRRNKELFDFVMVKDDELLCSSGLKDKLNTIVPMDIVWVN